MREIFTTSVNMLEAGLAATLGTYLSQTTQEDPGIADAAIYSMAAVGTYTCAKLAYQSSSSLRNLVQGQTSAPAAEQVKKRV